MYFNLCVIVSWSVRRDDRMFRLCPPRRGAVWEIGCEYFNWSGNLVSGWLSCLQELLT